MVKEAEEAKEKEDRKAKFEEKMLVVNRRVRDGSATPAEEAAWRRWMGPRAWLLLVVEWERGGRGRKRGRGTRVPLSLFFSWCAVFPFVDDRPKMLDIMDGTEQKNSHVLLTCKVRFPGFSAPRAVFPSLSSGPRCSASWPVWIRRIFRHVQGLVCWYLTMSLALCSSWFVSGPKMPVIMAGMDHRTVMWRFTGAVLGQGLLHARWCAMSGVMVQTVQKTVWRFHRCCSSSRSSDILFVLQEAGPHGPDCSADHRDSSDAVRFQGGRCPCCAGRAVPQVVHLCIQRTAWFDRGYHIFASVYEEFHVFLREKVGLRILRSILDSQVYPPVTCSLRRLRST